MNAKLKSKITTFQMLGTNPIDYELVLNHTHVSHCQLCGSALDYPFRLKHCSSTPEDQSKDLLVGCDCVENFMDTYFPLKKENIKRKMREFLDKTKSSIFLEQNPEIKQQCLDIKNYFNNTLRLEAKDKEMLSEYWSILHSDFYRDICKDLNSVLRKNYLSKPRLKKLYALKQAIADNKILPLLDSCKESRLRKIEQDKVSDEPFYNIYLKAYSSCVNMLERPALNIFQKQSFLKRTKNKSLKIEILPEIY